LAGAVSVTIEHDQDDGFDDSLRRVVTATGACRETLWGVKFLERGPGRSYRLSQAMMTLVLGTMFRSGKFPPIFMNIGVLDDSRLKFGEILPVAAHVSGSIPKGPGYGPTVSTYRDTLTVWMGNYERDMAPRMVEQVLQGMRDELQTANATGNA
jgi:NRPS condensation-like uncharacterized protein